MKLPCHFTLRAYFHHWNCVQTRTKPSRPLPCYLTMPPRHTQNVGVDSQHLPSHILETKDSKAVFCRSFCMASLANFWLWRLFASVGGLAWGVACLLQDTSPLPSKYTLRLLSSYQEEGLQQQMAVKFLAEAIWAEHFLVADPHCGTVCKALQYLHFPKNEVSFYSNALIFYKTTSFHPNAKVILYNESTFSIFLKKSINVYKTCEANSASWKKPPTAQRIITLC